MRDLFFKLFNDKPFGTQAEFSALSLSHVFYFVLIVGLVIGGYFLLRKKTEEQKGKALRILAYALVISYLSDFFVHEFVYEGLSTDKLPFHICTVLCPLVAIAQFNKKGSKIIEPIVVLSILAPLMYISYPAGVSGAAPWSYRIVQTMFYHGVLFAWGVLSVALGLVKLNFKKNWWHVAVLLGAITLWAKLGNILLEHNWFFLEEDAFYIGLVGNGIIPAWLLMIINPIVFFGAASATYGVVALIKKLAKKQ